ncbi:MAG: S1 RNA-binding domain-containing protein [Myxococcales bacterium]|nr:S1 RNA-binding domain-containing protein [Myxococcales bacterium]
MSESNESNEDFAAMLVEFEPAARGTGPKKGQMVKGRVVSISGKSVFLDLGGKSEGAIDREELLDADGELSVKLGDSVEARVAEIDGPSGCVILRRTISKGADAGEALRGAYEAGIPVEGLVSGLNKGGLEVEVAGNRAFCPISQIDVRFVEDANHFVGQKYQFKITKLEAGRGKNMNIVLSRRKLLEDENAVQAAVLRETLREGQVLKGLVTTLKDYGAFVDLGGIEGMLHISELGHARVGHPSEILSVDQTIEVKVMKIEPAVGARKEERISLSIKALHDSPWASYGNTLKSGTQVQGTVVRLQPFGAFIELSPGIEGLAHISELGAGKRINHPREVMAEGDTVQVTVLSVDTSAQRISLTLRSPEDIPDAVADRQAVKDVNAANNKGLGTFADLLQGKI